MNNATVLAPYAPAPSFPFVLRFPRIVAMLQAPDGRMRLRNPLKHHLFSRYDLIIIDLKGSASVMLELILLAVTEFAIGVIKPILPDTREFLRGTVGVMALLPDDYR